MVKQFFLILILIAVLSVLATACKKTDPSFKYADPIGCVDIAPGEPLRLGVLQALSGKVASLGLEQVRGIELAIAKRRGQLLGHPIALQREDSRCTSEGGTMAALKIVTNPKIIAVLGTTCSGAAITASKVISDAGLAMVSGNNSASSLTSVGGKQGPDWYPGYFRTSSNGGVSGQAAAMFAFRKLGVRKAATINDGDVYTRGLAHGFRRAFEDLGGKIVLHTAVNKGDMNMKPILTAVSASQAELLFLPLFQPEGDFIVLQTKEVPGLENLTLMGNGALIVNTFVESVGADGTGMYFIGPAPSEGPGNDALADEYQARYDASPSTTYYTYAYDAANLLLNAIESAAVQENDGRLHIGRQALRDVLYATKDFKGVTGHLSCDRFGDCGSARFNIVRLDDPSAGLEGLASNVIYRYAPDQQTSK